jgi:MYXO-CTERM domain-containing protein
VSHSTAEQNGHAVNTTYPPGTPQALEAEVERNREQLAATVDALHRKLDVKAQAKARAARLRESATTDSGKPSPAVLGIAALAVAGVGLLVWRRSRR